jgi:hypothetical protein
VVSQASTRLRVAPVATRPRSPTPQLGVKVRVTDATTGTHSEVAVLISNAHTCKGHGEASGFHRELPLGHAAITHWREGVRAHADVTPI